MGEAIETTQKLYPGLLDRNANLLFVLKCRQFIEMVNGTDSEVRGAAMRSPRSRHGSGSARSSPSMSPVHHAGGGGGKGPGGGSSSGTLSAGSSPSRIIPTTKPHSVSHSASSSSSHNQDSTTSSSSSSNKDSGSKDLHSISESEMNSVNVAMNGAATTSSADNVPKTIVSTTDSDVDMLEGSDCQSDHSESDTSRTVSNGTAPPPPAASTNGTCVSNGVTAADNLGQECDMGKTFLLRVFHVCAYLCVRDRVPYFLFFH